MRLAFGLAGLLGGGTSIFIWINKGLHDTGVFLGIVGLSFLSLYALRQALWNLLSLVNEKQPEKRHFLFRRFVFLSAIKLSTFVMLLGFIRWSVDHATDWVIALGCGAYIWIPLCYALGVRDKDLSNF